MNNEKPEFLTIRQTGKRGPLKESTVRRMQKQGLIPGVQVGRVYYVNYGQYLEKIDKMSMNCAAV